MSESDTSGDEVNKPKSFIDQLEEEFKDRYTVRDTEYIKQYKRELSKPPCVHPWSGRSNDHRHNKRS